MLNRKKLGSVTQLCVTEDYVLKREFKLPGMPCPLRVGQVVKIDDLISGSIMAYVPGTDIKFEVELEDLDFRPSHRVINASIYDEDRSAPQNNLSMVGV